MQLISEMRRRADGTGTLGKRAALHHEKLDGTGYPFGFTSKDLGLKERTAAPVKEEEKHYEGEAWRCPVCSYVYEGELPGDFICPRCEQPRSIFERIENPGS